ncbi:DNA double-strand break repair nuclease NurA [Thermoplasma sp.]|uniref:DNA double-strand break repair nuclease NurA n=1 Tax=Thermoplasma sp. TaxID=1973142 RepID=UPI00126C0306|nr:DNA double-strand break repair nuclease NurA [Thermoplasma sp.]KAA8922674.1 MAG: serotonin receptor [Thermoplasma sp.]
MSFDSDAFTQYREYLRQNANSIRDAMIMPRDSPLRSVYRDPFTRHYTDLPEQDADVKDLSISATDSSEFSRELYSGPFFILVRSYSKIHGKIYVDFRSSIKSVTPEEVKKETIMMMESSEHRSLLKLINSESPDISLVDGSLMGRIGRCQNYQMSVDADEDYCMGLRSLLEAAAGKTTLVFVSKSTRSRVLRDTLLDEAEHNQLVDAERNSWHFDHYIIKSLAERPGYIKPLPVRMGIGNLSLEVMVSDILPRLEDVPIRFEVFGSHVPFEKVLQVMMYGYTGYKVYNLWLSDIDNMVKFRKNEVENVYLKEFERTTGIPFYETRGERRARIRI